jgi:type IV secretion system protein VirB10
MTAAPTPAPLWRRWFLKSPRPANNTDDTDRTPDAPADRGVALASSKRSLSSRVSQLLGFALITALTVSVITWYYAHSITSAHAAERQVKAATTKQAQGDTTLPPLTVTPPKLTAVSVGAPSTESKYLITDVLGRESTTGSMTAAPGTDPSDADDNDAILRATAARSGSASVNPTATDPNGKSPAQLALERQLNGSVFARSSAPPPITAIPPTNPDALTQPDIDPTTAAIAPSTPKPTSALNQRLRTVATVSASATQLPTQRLLLPKGAFIDCTLETAIDSTLPGLTTCITAVDTFSADGTVVLMERGTKLIGETQGDAEQGRARLFVLWTEARTPKGVIVPLSSPGTDALGRAGISGKVNRHFFDRFGAALLISVIDGTIQAAAANQASGASGTTVVLNPSGTRDVMTEVLKSTVSISPTITVKNGSRIQILVARDVDFRSVYSLQAH